MTDLRSKIADEPASRAGVASRIVAIFEGAIAEGELGAEAKLPPTRQLAELAGVNHLTAARAYRLLAERGLVASRVGSGTFVRAAAVVSPPSALSAQAVQDGTAWQRYSLPDEVETYGDRLLGEMFSSSAREGLIPLMVGYPGDALLPHKELARIGREVLSEEGLRPYQYGCIEGLTELRRAIAGLAGAHAIEGDVLSNVLIATGARQSISLVCRALLRPGDVVAVESPTYTGLIEGLRDQGATLLGVPSDDDGFDVDALECLLERREVRMIALQPRAQNPTGRDLCAPRREALLRIARERNIFILEDAVYADLRFQGEHPPSLRTLAPEHVVYVGSLSKTVAPGMRIGWVSASGPVLERLVREKRNDDLHSSVLPQMVAARLIESGGFERQLERAAVWHAERAEAMVAAVESELGSMVEMTPPLGGGHVWVKLDPSISERDLFTEARRRGVSFLPGAAMRPERSREGGMRLSFSYLDPPAIAEGVAMLGDAMRSLLTPGRVGTPAMPVA